MSEELWIQGSIRHEGRVHRYIMREYGEKAMACHASGRCTIKGEYLDRAIERAKAMHETSLEGAAGGQDPQEDRQAPDRGRVTGW